MAFGWQIFNASGTLVADQSVIMSRRLGVYEIGFIGGIWSTRINVAFNGGTPFAHCVVIPGRTVPGGYSWAAIPPDIYCGANYIDISYPAKLFEFPDDTTYPPCVGNYYLHYGVYNA